jgi:outer membrane protein OmpA-like peptidoglycan-associated protein
LVVLGAAVLQLAGCSSVPDAVNPISWYRDISGASKNDDLGKDQNQQNLQEGSNEPFPNLGTVPPEPDTALSGIDRDKLVNSLIADRNNAQYSSDDLRPGRTAVTAPPPPPPAPAPPPEPAQTTTSSAAPAPSSSSAAPAPPPAPPQPSSPPAAAAPTTETPAQPAPQTAQAAPRRAPARGSEAPPPESSLQSPKVKSVPEGEAVTPAPPPPQMSAPQAAAAPNAPAAPPPAAAPHLKPPSAPPQQQAAAPAVAPKSASARHPTISYRVADVAFATGSALLPNKLQDTIAGIVKLHNDNGGTIRIVGHGESTGGNAAMTGFTLALDRAQAVAVALTNSGIAAKDISVEAAPVAARGGTDVPRAEIYLEN